MKTVHSMTGFCSVDCEIAGTRYRLEMKALNHRFLDVKVRLPRELSSAEVPLRTLVQNAFTRGVVEVKVDRMVEGALEPEVEVHANLALAASYYEALLKIQRTLGLSDTLATGTIASFPNVISGASREVSSEELWKGLEPLAKNGIRKLQEMRAHEGATLTQALCDALDELGERLTRIVSRRKEWEPLQRERLKEKVSSIFEAYPLSEKTVQQVLETRVTQELAIVLDKSDIQEEITRFEAHLAHFRKTLDEGGTLGRKLDFILQELGREINTLGNKAQDLQTSEEVVSIKVKLEQLREQVMNLE